MGDDVFGDLLLGFEGAGCDGAVAVDDGDFVGVVSEAVDNEVIFLKRLSMGSLRLDENLKPGEYRELTPEELAALTS